MVARSIPTFQDAVEHIIDVANVGEDRLVRRRARESVRTAYRKLQNMHAWAYYERRGQFSSVASGNTGTVVYDHTGGTYERQLTLTGSTWPTFQTNLYKLILNSNQYKIDAWKSSTVVTLEEGSNPGADLPSSGYVLYKSEYRLPDNFRRMSSEVIDIARSFYLQYATPKALLNYQSGNFQPQESILYTIANNDEYYGENIIELAPPPNFARTWDFVYEAMARPLKYEAYSEGALTTNGTTTVTGLATSWKADMVGSMLHLPTTAGKMPAGAEGGIQGEAAYAESVRIMSVANANSMTVETAPSSLLNNSLYVITDPLDIEPNAMLTLIYRMAEAEYMRISRSKDRREADDAVRESLIEAKIADNTQRESVSSSLIDRSNYTLRDWAVAQQFGGSPLG